MKVPSAGNDCALVLSSVPLICAGLTAVVNRATGARMRTLNGPWEDRHRLLPALILRLRLVIADPGTTFTTESLSRLMQSSGGAAVIIALPDARLRIRETPYGARLYQIPLAAKLEEWLRVVNAALGLTENFRSAGTGAAASSADSTAAAAADGSGRTVQLTKRQMEVYELLSQGLSNSEIAERIGTTVGTAKLHVAAVMEALQATRRIDIVLRRATSAQVNMESDTTNDASSKIPRAVRADPQKQDA